MPSTSARAHASTSPALRRQACTCRRNDKGAAAVWVVDPLTRKARRVAVTTGPYGDDGVDVRSGLKPDDWVVLAGGHLLHEGVLVQPVDRSNRPVLGVPVQNASLQAK